MPNVTRGNHRRVSDRGLLFIRRQEGCILHPYLDQVGIWTIGVGHVMSPIERMRYANGITQQDADQLLRADILWVESEMGARIKVDVTQNQWDATASLTFNCGLAPLRMTFGKMLNAGDYAGAADQITRWSKGGSPPKDLPVLVRRRALERAMFLEPDSTTPEAA